MIEIRKISVPSSEFDIACQIRREVFVEEQKVNPEEEFDEFEGESQHFLAYWNQHPAATCRYRKTSKGWKLERFAVLKSYRRKGLGLSLVQACLENIDVKDYIYLHAQLDAIPLYDKAGFVKYGPLFYECEIAHYAMHYVK